VARADPGGGAMAGRVPAAGLEHAWSAFARTSTRRAREAAATKLQALDQPMRSGAASASPARAAGTSPIPLTTGRSTCTGFSQSEDHTPFRYQKSDGWVLPEIITRRNLLS